MELSVRSGVEEGYMITVGRTPYLLDTLLVLSLLISAFGCVRSDSPPAPVAVNREGLAARMSLVAEEEPQSESGVPRETEGTTPPVAPPGGTGGSVPAEVSPERAWGRADLDPENDREVAPPDPVPDCTERLTALGAKFRAAELPLRQLVDEIPTCGSHDAVSYEAGPLGMSVRPAALMSCQMALGMVALESLVQELAVKHFGEQVRSLHQGGTYACRKMERFDLVSEHSYGNAIDVYAFTLVSGKKISVVSHYGALDQEPTKPEARFLRELASSAYDQDLFSVALSPYWDTLHRDHFHFDMARYRVDGTRAR